MLSRLDINDLKALLAEVRSQVDLPPTRRMIEKIETELATRNR